MALQRPNVARTTPPTGLRRPAPAAAPTPAPVEEVLEDEVVEEVADEVVEDAADEVVEEVAAKPATKAAPAKPAAKPAVKAAPAKPAAKPAVKAAPAKPAAKATAVEDGEETAPSKKARTPAAVGPAVNKLELVLPEEIGGRITMDMTQELFFRYLKQNEAKTGLTVASKAQAVDVMNAVFSFLMGTGDDVPTEINADQIVEKGGLLRLFEAKLYNGIHFKHSLVDSRCFPNPKYNPEDQENDHSHFLVEGRQFITLRTQVEDGTSIPGYRDEEGNFIPKEEKKAAPKKAAVKGARK